MLISLHIASTDVTHFITEEPFRTIEYQVMIREAQRKLSTI